MSYEIGPGIEPEKRTWSYLKYIVGLGMIALIVHWFITDIDNISKGVRGFYNHWTGNDKLPEPPEGMVWPESKIYQFSNSQEFDIGIRFQDGNLVNIKPVVFFNIPEEATELIQVIRTKERIASVVRNSIRRTAINYDTYSVYKNPSKFKREAQDNLTQDLWQFGMSLQEIDFRDFKYTDEFLGKVRKYGTVSGSG